MTTDEQHRSAQELIQDLSPDELNSVGEMVLSMKNEMNRVTGELEERGATTLSGVDYTLPLGDLYGLCVFAEAAWLREASRREYGEEADPQ